MCYDLHILPKDLDNENSKKYQDSDNDEATFRYKPLFLVLMYLLCASILFPISIWKHFMNKANLKKKRASTTVSESCSTILNEDKSVIPLLDPDYDIKKIHSKLKLQVKTSLNSTNSNDLIKPILVKSLTETNLIKLKNFNTNQVNNMSNSNSANNNINKKVLFDVQSNDSNNNEIDCPVGEEAIHILNHKPWAKAHDSIVAELRTIHNFSSNDSILRSEFKSNSIGNINKKAGPSILKLSNLSISKEALDSNKSNVDLKCSMKDLNKDFFDSSKIQGQFGSSMLNSSYKINSTSNEKNLLFNTKLEKNPSKNVVFESNV